MEEEEEEEEEPTILPSHGARSCSSLIRLEQELKRKGREEQQKQRQRLMSVPGKDSQSRRGTLGLPWEQASTTSLPRVSISTVSSIKRDSDDILDFVELTRRQPWWRRLFASPSSSHKEKYNVLTQLTIGGGIGWCTGFIFQRVGKLAATAVGGGFFLLQVASHTGYVKVDWQLLEHDVTKAKEQLKFHGASSGNLPPDVRNRVDEVIAFLKKNVVLAGGFVGGFLLGMAS